MTQSPDPAWARDTVERLEQQILESDAAEKDDAPAGTAEDNSPPVPGTPEPPD